MLMHSYGLPITDVTWVTTREERVSGKLPPSIEIQQVEPGRRLESLLLAGEIDALVEPDLPEAWLHGKGTLARLFPDCEKEEPPRPGERRLLVVLDLGATTVGAYDLADAATVQFCSN